MAKKDFKDLLGKKSPSELRKGIQQIDILKEASEALSSSKDETEKSEQESTSVKEIDKPVVESRSVDPSINQVEISDNQKQSIKTKKSTDDKTERTNRSTSRRKPKVFSQKDIQAVLEVDKRATERYSFEIYSDQKEDIQQVCDQYEKVTGKKLSASRLIREVLDTFLPDALKTFESTEKN